MAFELTMCSLADRYRAYRLVYLLCLLITFVSFSGLFVPMFFTLAPLHQADITAPAVESTSSINTSSSYDNETIVSDFAPATDLPLQDDVQRSWIYYVSLCIIIGSMSSSVCRDLNDSFSANISRVNNIPFGSVRIYGAFGSISASLAQVFINKIPSDYFHLQTLSLFVVLGLINLILVAFWPDKEPFKLDLKAPDQGQSDVDLTQNKTRLKFKFLRSNFWLNPNKTLFNCEKNTQIGIGGSSDITITKAEVNFQFDTRAEDAFRNIRRCSLAPLGDSFVIKQFELDNQGKKHFNNVTKIHPVGQESSSDMPTTMELIVDSGEGNSVTRHDSILSAQVAVNPTYLPSGYDDEKKKEIGFMLHCRIIKMIASRSEFVYRFWVLSVINGFILSMSWSYLVPYLESLDAVKFSSLVAYLLVTNQLCQTIFFRFLSPYMSKTVDPFASISLIQLGYGMRYALYLLFTFYKGVIPLECILLIELSHLFSISWLICVTNELALKFASEARDCIPELLKLNLIEDNDVDKEKVTNGVKCTMLGISSCCFEGIGVACGALASGWMVTNYGYVTFWITGASLAFLSGLVNGLINLKDLILNGANTKASTLSSH